MEFGLLFTKLFTSIFPCKKGKLKIFLIPYSTLDGFSNDTSHSSLRWVYRSGRIDCTINLFEFIVLPPQVGRNNKIVIFALPFLLWCQWSLLTWVTSSQQFVRIFFGNHTVMFHFDSCSWFFFVENRLHNFAIRCSTLIHIWWSTGQILPLVWTLIFLKNF